MAKGSARSYNFLVSRRRNAQRLCAIKQQYRAKLLRDVEALVAICSKFDVLLKFMEQREIILVLENQTLMQQFECLAQQQLVNCLEQQMLEKEVAELRLRALQKHQQQQSGGSVHGHDGRK